MRALFSSKSLMSSLDPSTSVCVKLVRAPRPTDMGGSVTSAANTADAGAVSTAAASTARVNDEIGVDSSPIERLPEAIVVAGRATLIDAPTMRYASFHVARGE